MKKKTEQEIKEGTFVWYALQERPAKVIGKVKSTLVLDNGKNVEEKDVKMVLENQVSMARVEDVEEGDILQYGEVSYIYENGLGEATIYFEDKSIQPVKLSMVEPIGIRRTFILNAWEDLETLDSDGCILYYPKIKDLQYELTIVDLDSNILDVNHLVMQQPEIEGVSYIVNPAIAFILGQERNDIVIPVSPSIIQGRIVYAGLMHVDLKNKLS